MIEDFAGLDGIVGWNPECIDVKSRVFCSKLVKWPGGNRMLANACIVHGTVNGRGSGPGDGWSAHSDQRSKARSYYPVWVYHE
jgi:hypothetical protein